ncbi:hypothetical protein CFOL_v3_24061 [Cephalotus follicularis]|uniref:Uncharacterized protein n=1 Tax=Cephalotus follicularis TaxID=3775 RepID=A0A1Q3CKI4_CEPFO|nr:hypothetical protein CFOL_v3_24061 [Cephalotus follicularis]
MANFSTSFHLLVLLLAFTSVKNMMQKVDAVGCEVAVRGGGCPDIKKCIETCLPCFRGIGRINAYCRLAGGGIPFDECICRFSKGAPCYPPSPPRCPKPPSVN